MSAEQTPVSPLGRLLSKLAPIESREVPAVVAAFCLFFCVFAGYFAVRPVRETIGTLLGKERVADLFVVTWIASIAIIPIYGYLVGKFKPQRVPAVDLRRHRGRARHRRHRPQGR